MTAVAVPAGFEPLVDPGAFVDSAGPFYGRERDGAVGLRVEDRHLNRGGSVMGGLLATLVDAAFGRAVRAEAESDAVATVSLTTDFLRPGPAGAWIEAHTEIEQLGGRLAFGDCSVRTEDGTELVRARAVFAVRSAD